MEIRPDAHAMAQQKYLNAAEAMTTGGLIGAGLSILLASLGYALYYKSTAWTYMSHQQWCELCAPTEDKLNEIYYGGQK